MIIYLLCPLPTLIAALLYTRIGERGLLALWLATSVALVALMPIGSRDYETYLQNYAEINGQAWSAVIVQDPLYATMVWLCGHIGIPAVLFYMSFAVGTLAVKLVALHRLCSRRTLPIALYMCSYFFLHEFTQMRAGLAIGIWMLALLELPRSRRRYLALTLLASLVHVQAVLGLLIFPLIWLLDSRRRVRVAGVVSVGLVALSIVGVSERMVQHALTLVPDPRVEIYLQLTEVFDTHLNPLNIISLLALATGLVGLWPRQQALPPHAEPPLNLRTSTFVFVGLLLGSCSLAALASVPIAAQRVSEHFFALLPAGMSMAATRLGLTERQRQAMWLVALLCLYIFLIHSPYLLDPATGRSTDEG